jgi:hypothetical protein
VQVTKESIAQDGATTQHAVLLREMSGRYHQPGFQACVMMS